MSTSRKKEDFSKNLPQASNLLGMETNSEEEAAQFSHFLGVIKAHTAQLLNSKNKMPAVNI